MGVIGTLATIQSGAYEDAIRRRKPDAVIHSLACPLLVSFAEEGWLDDPITDAVCRRYLNQIPFEVRTVVLGCTHYPILLPSLARTRPGTTWLDSGELTAKAVDACSRAAWATAPPAPGATCGSCSPTPAAGSRRWASGSWPSRWNRWTWSSFRPGTAYAGGHDPA